MMIQGSRKLGCPAHIIIKVYETFPEYAISEREISCSSKKALKKLKEHKLKQLKSAITNKESIQIQNKYFISLPAEEAHMKTHPTGAIAGAAQKMNPVISKKIESLVREGTVDGHTIQGVLKEYVNTTMRDNLPCSTDRPYYSTVTDINNHVTKAKSTLQLSKLDQQNLYLKVQEWKKANPESNHFFRPFKNPQGDEHTGVCNDSESLLWVHQEKWQRDLLIRYGKTLSLIDATYKTTKYDLPLFFVCVRTNTRYMIVAEFIVQSESAENILEALNIIKQWNPTWNPKFFLCDYSDAEIAAIEQVFPGILVISTVSRRGQDGFTTESMVSPTVMQKHFFPCSGHVPGLHLEKMEHRLITSSSISKIQVWKQNPQVSQWLNGVWLKCPEVCC